MRTENVWEWSKRPTKGFAVYLTKCYYKQRATVGDKPERSVVSAAVSMLLATNANRDIQSDNMTQTGRDDKAKTLCYQCWSGAIHGVDDLHHQNDLCAMLCHTLNQICNMGDTCGHYTSIS